MAKAIRHQCQYLCVPVPYSGQTRACQQSARWLVSYLAPDDGVNMRTRKREMRCKTHTETRFFPKGASGITTELIEDALPRATTPQRDDDNG
jgi:hypothetical protein